MKFVRSIAARLRHVYLKLYFRYIVGPRIVKGIEAQWSDEDDEAFINRYKDP